MRRVEWNKKVKGHLFDHDPTDEIEALLLTGEFKTKFAGDFFQTPPELAKRMVAWAVRTGDLVLEPSAGHGRIAAEILKVTPRLFCNEVDPQRAAKTEDELGVKVICSDFLKATPPGALSSSNTFPDISKTVPNCIPRSFSTSVLSSIKTCIKPALSLRFMNVNPPSRRFL
jgi:16S rRNA A1518/A1519 N6-dimethyltransferase RsmA/KsgA/DIM1 with predicted DNA glycosylase/AP lyase activity